MDFKEDERWFMLGVSVEFLEEKAAWLREPRQLHHTSVNFFDLAARLLLWSRFDYLLASLAFFQAVVGLERAFRIHYDTDQEHFSEMFGRAVSEGHVSDVLFQSVRPLPKELLGQIDRHTSTHAEALALLVPKLRNQFVHGTYIVSPEYLWLAFQMREIADVLDTRKHGREWNTR